MEVRLSRRRMMQGVAGAAMAQSLAIENAQTTPEPAAPAALPEGAVTPAMMQAALESV